MHYAVGARYLAVMPPARFAERTSRSTRATALTESAVPGPVVPGPALVVGAADDRAELEADRLASEVIARLGGEHAGHPGHAHADAHGEVRRAPAPADAEAEVGAEGGAVSSDLSARIEGRRGSGRSLAEGVRGRLEAGFGSSLADVRVHDDAESAALNRAVSARAFTVGKDIFFGAGEYDPESPEGERVLAHEVAHTRQAGSGARRSVIRRWWDFSQPRFDWSRAASMRTLKHRMVWFVTDQQGDDMVVKMENQPVGLAQLTGEMHSSFGTAGSVVQKKLGPRDRAWLAGMLQNPAVSAGDSWGKYATSHKGMPAPPLRDEDMDQTNADEFGRMMALNAVRTGADDMLAMTLAPGKSAEEVAAPNFGGTGYDPNVSMFRTFLEQPKHAQQLGRIAAVDLFMGNDDRVSAGNVGNWFYDPSGAVTLIDHVDQGTGMARKFARGGDIQSWAEQCGEQLRNDKLWATAVDCVAQMARAARTMGGDAGAQDWINETVDGQLRHRTIATHLYAGLVEQKKHLIKVFTATRFTVGGSKARAQKKALKTLAQQTAQEDAGHRQFGGGANEYYEAMKSRAAWLKKN